MNEEKPTAVEWIEPPDFYPAEPMSYIPPPAFANLGQYRDGPRTTVPLEVRAAVVAGLCNPQPARPLGVDWSAEDVAKCLAVFWNLGLTNPDDPGQRMEQDGPTITLLDTAGKPQRFRLVREFPEVGADS